MDEEVFLILSLLNIRGLGPIKITKLIQNEGEAEFFLARCPSRDQAKKAAEKEIQLAHKLNVKLIPFTSELYPSKLLELKDFPPLLYIAGHLDKDSQGVAIIGTRQATPYGLEMGERFGAYLAEEGYAVISGLARGIDTSAHRGALKTGKTIAIVGSGLANLYPSENKELARRIAQNGALISELPLHNPPNAYNFPRRNRLVSALAEALVLIEAPLKSGAMGTMTLGKEMNRPLFALPGRADSENYRGSHALIKSCAARLVESPKDVILALGGTPKAKIAAQRSTPTDEEARFLSFFSSEDISLDALAERTALPPHTLNVVLMRLLMKGHIKELPGKRYRKLEAIFP